MEHALLSLVPLLSPLPLLLLVRLLLPLPLLLSVLLLSLLPLLLLVRLLSLLPLLLLLEPLLPLVRVHMTDRVRCAQSQYHCVVDMGNTEHHCLLLPLVLPVQERHYHLLDLVLLEDRLDLVRLVFLVGHLRRLDLYHQEVQLDHVHPLILSVQRLSLHLCPLDREHRVGRGDLLVQNLLEGQEHRDLLVVLECLAHLCFLEVHLVLERHLVLVVPLVPFHRSCTCCWGFRAELRRLHLVSHQVRLFLPCHPFPVHQPVQVDQVDIDY
jgi:hypothetical protein